MYSFVSDFFCSIVCQCYCWLLILNTSKYILLLMHLNVDWHLGSCQFFTIPSNIATNILVECLMIYTYMHLFGHLEYIYIYNFCKYCQNIFWSGCTNLYSHQNYMRVLVALQLLQHLILLALSFSLFCRLYNSITLYLLLLCYNWHVTY